MKSRNFTDCCKNAIGTVFLLAGAFFVCSTLLSMRSVLADPIAPMQASVATTQSARTSASPRASSRPVTTRETSNNTVARPSSGTTTTNSRAVVSRTATTNAVTRTATSTPTTTSTSRVAATASARPSTTVSRETATVTGNTSRNVVSRSTANTTSRVAVNNNRTVRSRTTTTPSRVSLQGSAIRGSKAAINSNTYTYLSNKLYTGNYSNIIDSTTGLISSDAYNNCLESYYACMDEICTARNSAQRRCACAGRVKAFAEAESALETANEELIKVSGELALLIATKGKDVSEAFQLTDAEKVMNCVSWQEASENGTASEADFGDWCEQHAIFDGTCSHNAPPSYCKESGNNFGFDVSSLDGTGSDILASLQSWANAKEATLTIISDDSDSLLSAFDNLTNVVGNLAGIDGAFADSENLKDSLAETWGYELFEYAHNNVCNRVLDSCFNGIYEACGTPPSNGRKCGNGASQCPYNYNSYISVSNTGTYELDFIEPNTGYTASNSATCFGYTTASGDPYSSLRGPVADARRSIMQKYALDANADCDAYGEQLRTTAQNIGYQKVAAQQALQQKRLEFAEEERETVLSEAISAGTNFNECLSEIYDCYETQASSNPNWPEARIKTYCAQIANVPHCYETMICNPSTSQFRAVIDKQDNAKCNNSQDYTQNTCRNIVTLNEILNGVNGAGTVDPETPLCLDTEAENCNSAALREQCLLNNGVDAIRTWKRADSGN